MKVISSGIKTSQERVERHGILLLALRNGSINVTLGVELSPLLLSSSPFITVTSNFDHFRDVHPDHL